MWGIYGYIISGISPLRTVENPRILGRVTKIDQEMVCQFPSTRLQAGTLGARRELVWCFSQAQNMWVFQRVFVSPEKRWDDRHDKDL